MNLLYLILTIIGFIICIKYKSRNTMFLYGMIFFIINILANIIGLFAEYLLYVGFMNAVITKTYMFFTISQCLNIGAYIILIIGFIQFARKYND